MKTKLVIKRPWNLTPSEYRDCVRTNMRDRGNMAHSIRTARKRKTKRYNINDAFIIMIKNAETKELIAQAYLEFITFTEARNPATPYSMYYVKQKYRRQGYGTRLIKQVNRICEEKGWNEFQVDPWDERSTDFFETAKEKAPLLVT